MKYFSYIAMLLLIGCRPDSGKKLNTPFKRSAILVYTDGPDEKYNNALIPDTSNCHSFRDDRGFFAFLVNKKCLVESTGAALYLSSGKLKMWVCNLPKETVHGGDTVVVSAMVYEIFGDERTWGRPTILHRISYKDPPGRIHIQH